MNSTIKIFFREYPNAFPWSILSILQVFFAVDVYNTIQSPKPSVLRIVLVLIGMFIITVLLEETMRKFRKK